MRCVRFVSSEKSQIKLASIDLQVREKPISISSPLSAQKLHADLLLQCEVSKPLRTDSEHSFEFKWLKDGVELNTSDKDKDETKHARRSMSICLLNEAKTCQLLIGNFSHEDSGLYEFRVSTPATTTSDVNEEPVFTESSTFRLDIKPNPFKTPMRVETDAARHAVLISFETIDDDDERDDHHPIERMSWSKDDQPLDLSNAAKYRFAAASPPPPPSKYVLEIRNVRKSDNGVYKCTIGEFANRLQLTGIEEVDETEDDVEQGYVTN